MRVTSSICRSLLPARVRANLTVTFLLERRQNREGYCALNDEFGTWLAR